jgi:hypothetical protein
MHNERRDPLDDIVAVLRAPVAADSSRKVALMAAVRGAEPPSAPSQTVKVRVRRSARRATHSASIRTLAVAAGIVAIAALGSRQAGVDAQWRDAVDPVEPVRRSSGDSMVAAFRDTMRLVRFMFSAPAARRVTVAGDFNDWDVHATPLQRSTPEGPWSVALTLAPGRHTYAFVVNDTQWVSDPAAPRAEPNELTPPRSVLRVK